MGRKKDSEKIMAEKFQINETCQATNQKELRNLLKQEK